MSEQSRKPSPFMADLARWKEEQVTGVVDPNKPPIHVLFNHEVTGDSGTEDATQTPFGVTAMVDPFAKIPDTVTVFPHEHPSDNSEAHLTDLSPGNYAAVGLVTQAVGRKMREQHPDSRVMIHREGFGVPGHAHEVMAPVERGDSIALHQPTDKPTAEQLSHSAERLAFTEEEKVALAAKIDIVHGLSAALRDAELTTDTVIQEPVLPDAPYDQQ